METTPLECSCSLLVETRARVFLFFLVTTTRKWKQDSRSYIENLLQFFHGIRTQSLAFANRGSMCSLNQTRVSFIAGEIIAKYYLPQNLQEEMFTNFLVCTT